MVMQKGSLSTSLNAKLLGLGHETTTVILAHGYGGDQTVWDKVTPSLRKEFQVLVFDWCFSGAVDKDLNLFDAEKYGCYEAFADDLIALMEEMGLKDAVFVGHSMSGMIGCIASIKRPFLFKRLVLVASSPMYLRLMNVEEKYDGGFELPVVEQLFANIESNYDQWATAFASIAVDNNDPLSIKKFANCLIRMGGEIALPLAKTVFLSDHRSILEKVTTPCTIIQTQNDVVVPDSVPKYMQKKIMGESTVEIIRTQGHFPQLTAPDQFLHVLFDKILSPSIKDPKQF